MPEQRSARKDPAAPLLEALVELARSAIRSDREALGRRATLRVVRGRRDAA
jgi:hypothetical protein